MGYLEPKSDKLVTQDYDLVHSVQRLDVRPKQLLLTAISHVNPQVPLSQQPKPFVVDITAQQWIETWGERLNPYRDLKESAEMLNGKRFWIQNDRLKKSWRNWITGAEYHEREGRITVQLHPDLMPYLCGAMTVFSTMKILHIKGLRSFASIRLYELANQFRLSGIRQISLEELRALLATKDAHPRFADFRRKVLEKAVKEINTKTDLQIRWDPVKKGRAVQGIKFYIKNNSQGDLFPSA
ncbi:MAG: plasmid replication initiation protein [Halieaceae bacterium]|jgi:plasmid replication initiation protein